MDSRRLVSLESFKAAHFPREDDEDSYDGSASEAEEDDEWLFAEDRKRKVKGKEPAKGSRKKKKHVVEDEPEDWISSAKIIKLCEILESIRTIDPTEKVIVFSQVPSAHIFTYVSLPAFSISSNLRSKRGTSNLDVYVNNTVRANVSMMEECQLAIVRKNSNVFDLIPRKRYVLSPFALALMD